MIFVLIGSFLNLPPKTTISSWERDDSSDSSRRSTPAPLPPPPPAHQRPSPLSSHSGRPPTPSHQPLNSGGAVDLSAPLDLSEVQDFSMSKKARPNSPPSLPQNKGKLDNMLSKLMKRKNVVSFN